MKVRVNCRGIRRRRTRLIKLKVTLRRKQNRNVSGLLREELEPELAG